MQITFIGGGNMATAIIGGLVKQGGHSLHVVDPNADKLTYLYREFGAVGSHDLPDSFTASDVVVLAVKPQQLKEICLQLASRLNGAQVVSIAAGIRIEALAHWLQTERIVRVMPNTLSHGGQGCGRAVRSGRVGRKRPPGAAETIMQAAGITVWLPEESGIDDITSVSGSGPAYVFYFIESMIEGAQQVGFSADEARRLVLATFDGALELARQSPLPVATLRQNVMSKGGTTERAIQRFEAEGVKAAIVAGALDCRDRSIELGQQLSRD
ncbi:pyrroline-5-carboxylate reductase [Paludibacterium denitrificans]|uniref:pyrroline-5-carboxylate reductase n=1 Tax=Paludibacterium denitrificans TaxID=2675226 RepID=UPI001E2E6266|nr:pyrroline-5-carboxylate reductase [Paludibacterium denitrificans]